MADESQTPGVQACAYASLVLVSLAVALDAPLQLEGPAKFQSLPYTAFFVAAVWISGVLISSMWRLSLTLVISIVVWTSLVQLFIQSHGNDQKLVTIAVYPLGWKGGPVYMLLAYIAVAALLLGPMLLRRRYPTLDAYRFARALLVSFVGLLACIAVLSLAGLSRFFDPLKILLTPYVFPLMASCVAVLLWGFLKTHLPLGKATNGPD